MLGPGSQAQEQLECRQPVAVSTLRQLGGLLVDLHGKRESESLLQPAYQLRLLDLYGHLETPRQNYQTTAEKVRDLRRRFTTLNAERQQ
jgi:DNA repair protein RecN (Recombination protein N)